MIQPVPRNLIFSSTRKLTRIAVVVAAAWAFWSFLCPGPRVQGQSATAMLSGTVVDERGAVVPGAGVTVSSAATGLHRQLQTGEDGYFTFPLIPPGTYTVRIERDGFAPVEIRDAALHVNDHLAYRVQLKVGEVGAYVVIRDASRYGVAASISTTIDPQFVTDLPFNAQGFHPLLDVSPGVVLTSANFNEQGQFSVNGQRANANYFTVDGVSANFGVSAGAAPGQSAAGSLPALTAFGATNNLVSVDALEELAIQTSSYAPEFGRLPGAQVSLVTRTGTREFHGSAFAYFRHDALSSNDWFASSRGLGKPHLRQNDLGVTLGGPLIKDKAFFFVSYEGLRMRQPQVAITEVPSTGIRQILAPPALRPFLNAFPIPNWFELTGRRVGLSEGRNGLEEFSASYSDPAQLDALGVRLDANVNERLTLFARYTFAPSETVQRGRGYVFGNFGQSLSTLSDASFQTVTLTAGARWELSPRISNDTRVNWSTARGATEFTLDDFGGAVPFDARQFASSATTESSLQFLILGGVNTSLGLGRNADNRQRQFNVVSNLAIVTPSHQLKFGVDYRRLSSVYEPTNYFQQVIFPAGLGPDRNPAIQEGRASQVAIFADNGARFPVFTNFSAFAQDVWRAGPRLMLTYGIRWELDAPPREKNGHHPWHAENTDDSAALRLTPIGTPLWKTTLGNFAPRVGAAYQLPGRAGTVLRAGAGLYYDAGGGPAAQVFGSVLPYTSVRRLDGVLYPLTDTQSASAPLTLQPPYDTVYAVDPNLKLPYTIQWNLTVDQPLGSAQTLQTSYVGAAGRRLLRQGVLTSDPIFREVRVISNTAMSDYHALQVQYQRRLSQKLQGVVSYTWAHSIDNASEDSEVNASAHDLTLPPDRSSSDFDVRHSVFGAMSYDLKAFGKGRFGKLLLGDLSVDTIFRMHTATPVNVFIGQTLLSGDRVDLTLPDLVAGRSIYLEDAAVAGNRRINREAFAPPGSTGQPLGRNALRGFGMWQIDMALHREFAISERFRLQARVEVFNVFNHPNFGNPVSDLGSGLFGQSIETLGSSLGSGGVNGGLSPMYQVGGPRTAQLGLRLKF